MVVQCRQHAQGFGACWKADSSDCRAGVQSCSPTATNHRLQPVSQCRAILRAQGAAGRELIPEVWLRIGSFCVWVLLFLAGRESRNSDGSQVRSLAL